MADRFPSLEEFDSGAQVEAKDPVIDLGANDTDDFLAREKAALGDDANQFVSHTDSAAFLDGDDDMIGGAGEEVTEFESSFPAISTQNEAVAPGGMITSSVGYSSGYQLGESEEEPAVIKEWRERRDLGLQERAARSDERKAATVAAARQNIDDFYDNYNTKKEKAVTQTRREADEFLAKREDTAAGGTSWERIAKLVDLSGKGAAGGGAGTGKERFRELLLSLKKDDKAPGASGV